MDARIFGIGAGPGDPSLLTLRATEVLGSATLLVAPRAREDAASVALGIVRAQLSDGCTVVEAVFPMSDEAGERTAAAREAARLLAAEASEGGTAVFVTLGDAMLYSTWGYVLRELRARHAEVQVETVPGVTALSAAAARLGRPLAEGAEPLLIWPKELPSDFGDLLGVAPNVVVLKAGRRLEQLVTAASDAGASVSAVRRLGMDREEVAADASELLGGAVDYFTTAIVHREASDESE